MSFLSFFRGNPRTETPDITSPEFDPVKHREAALKKLKSTENFCVYPFLQMSTVPSGAIRPCCFYEDFIRDENGHPKRVSSGVSFGEVWNSEHFQRIRKNMLENKRDSACQQCHTEEKLGTSSMRYRGFKDWFDNEDVKNAIVQAPRNDFKVERPPKYLEVKPGNVCNLKCRMCRAGDSNQVHNELKELSVKLNNPNLKDADRFRSWSECIDQQKQDFIETSNRDWEENSSLWNEIESMLPHLETISFAGGEPTLLPGTHRVLKKAVASGHSKHITVFLASNFSHIPPNLKKVCTEFKMFEFIASIDGTEAVQEYIRCPSRWADVKRNFEEVFPLMQEGRTKILINCTLQILNVLNYTDVLDWLEHLDGDNGHFFHHPYNLNVLSDPKYLSINILPVKKRTTVIKRTLDFKKRSKFVKRFPELRDRLDLICEIMSEPLIPNYRNDLKEFWNFTHIFDEHRGQSLKASIPELYEAMKEEVERLDFGQTNWNRLLS